MDDRIAWIEEFLIKTSGVLMAISMITICGCKSCTLGKRKFKRVAKTKGGVPKKYVRGAKNPKAREAEIKRTAKRYRQGKRAPAMMAYK